ncbi:MAG: hypothetical protein MK171_13035, partial [Pirellulales bacterium]|nr:hypothetical protein [Pirellulales bacterium]
CILLSQGSQFHKKRPKNRPGKGARVGMAPLGLLSPLNHQFLVVQPVLSMEIKFPISPSPDSRQFIGIGNKAHSPKIIQHLTNYANQADSQICTQV